DRDLPTQAKDRRSSAQLRDHAPELPRPRLLADEGPFRLDERCNGSRRDQAAVPTPSPPAPRLTSNRRREREGFPRWKEPAGLRPVLKEPRRTPSRFAREADPLRGVRRAVARGHRRRGDPAGGPRPLE